MEKKDTALVVMTGTDEMIKKAKASLTADTVGTAKALKQLKDTYENLAIGGVKDLAGYNVVKEGIKTISKMRIAVETRRKELTAPALKFQKELKAAGDKLIETLAPLEDHLKAQKVKFDDLAKAAEEQLFTERCKTLAENGYQLQGDFYLCGALQVSTKMIVKLTEDEITFYVNEGAKEIARQAAEEKRKEEERAAINKEREEIAAERAELAAQRLALEEKYGTIEVPAEKIYGGIEVQPVKTTPTETTPGAETKEAPIEATKTLKEDDLSINFKAGQVAGFDDFRERVVVLLGGTQKYTRAQIVEWAQAQKIEENVV